MTDKKIIAIHVKPPRAKKFVPFTEDIHFNDTPLGVFHAKQVLDSLRTGAGYKGHTFKLVRQTIKHSTKISNGPQGRTISETVGRTTPKDIANTLVKGPSDMSKEAQEHNDFRDNVIDFVKSTNEYTPQTDAKGISKSSWEHLGYSDPETMVCGCGGFLERDLWLRIFWRACGLMLGGSLWCV